MTPDDFEVTFKKFGFKNWPYPPSFMSKHQRLPIRPRMNPDDLEVNFKLFGFENRPYPPRFISIHQCSPIWPRMTLKWTSKILALRIDPIYQVSCSFTNVYPLDLGWPMMTLKWPSKMLVPRIDPTHQVSCPYTNVRDLTPRWPYTWTPDPQQSKKRKLAHTPASCTHNQNLSAMRPTTSENKILETARPTDNSIIRRLCHSPFVMFVFSPHFTIASLFFLYFFFLVNASWAATYRTLSFSSNNTLSSERNLSNFGEVKR